MRDRSGAALASRIGGPEKRMRKMSFKKESHRDPSVNCPLCASEKTVKVDEHFGNASFFCMNCEHTWTVRIPETAGALLVFPSSAAPPQQQSRRSDLPLTSSEAIRRATATVERARTLLSIATDLLRHALFNQQRRALIRRAEQAVH